MICCNKLNNCRAHRSDSSSGIGIPPSSDVHTLALVARPPARPPAVRATGSSLDLSASCSASACASSPSASASEPELYGILGQHVAAAEQSCCQIDGSGAVPWGGVEVGGDGGEPTPPCLTAKRRDRKSVV